MKLKSLILIILPALIINCKKEYKEKQGSIFSTTLPQTMAQGDIETFEITIKTGHCDEFSRLEEMIQDTTYFLTAFVKFPVKAKCPDDIHYITITHNISPSSKGNYIFKFWRPNNKYLVDSLKVL